MRSFAPGTEGRRTHIGPGWWELDAVGDGEVAARRCHIQWVDPNDPTEPLQPEQHVWLRATARDGVANDLLPAVNPRLATDVATTEESP